MDIWHEKVLPFVMELNEHLAHEPGVVTIEHEKVSRVYGRWESYLLPQLYKFKQKKFEVSEVQLHWSCYLISSLNIFVKMFLKTYLNHKHVCEGVPVKVFQHSKLKYYKTNAVYFCHLVLILSSLSATVSN
jgi:hypothetical protein